MLSASSFSHQPLFLNYLVDELEEAPSSSQSESKYKYMFSVLSDFPLFPFFEWDLESVPLLGMLHLVYSETLL